MIQTLAPKIKTFWKREPLVFIPNITRVQQGASLSAVLFNIDLIPTSIEENDQLYFVAGVE